MRCSEIDVCCSASTWASGWDSACSLCCCYCRDKSLRRIQVAVETENGRRVSKMTQAVVYLMEIADGMGREGQSWMRAVTRSYRCCCCCCCCCYYSFPRENLERTLMVSLSDSWESAAVNLCRRGGRGSSLTACCSGGVWEEGGGS